MSGRLFGTDGIRGRAGAGPLAEPAVSALGRAVGRVLLEAHPDAPRRALLGHDGRRSGPGLEAALARGLAAAGLEPVSAGLLPTPGVAWLAVGGDFTVAAMVSASHNPAHDNGIKLFDAGGGKLPDALEDAIQRALESDPAPADGGAPPAHDPALERAYLEHLLAAVPGLDLAGLTVAVDCANGAGSRVAPSVLGRLGARVVPLAAEPDGENINAGCGSTHPEALQAAVVEAGANLGVALDGDGDRCLLVDERGRLVDGDALMALLALDARARGALPGDRLVATVMSNQGLHRALRAGGVSVATVDVGDRRVVEGLRREGAALGGEQSGHIVFGADNAFIGDGTYTALRALEVLRRAGGRPLSELAAVFEKLPQVLVNVTVSAKPAWAELPAVGDAVRAAEAELGEDGRVLLRYSGTEPLARVMVEGPDEARIAALARGIADRVGDAIGA